MKVIDLSRIARSRGFTGNQKKKELIKILQEDDNERKKLPPPVARKKEKVELNPNGVDPVNLIPKEIMLEIISYLRVSDIGASLSVSKAWNNLFSYVVILFHCNNYLTGSLRYGRG